MKYVRFYLEHDRVADKRAGQHSGNVFAAFVGNELFQSGGLWCYEGLGGVYSCPDSPVASTAASADVIRQRFKRISEAQARAIHPQLFARLDEGAL